MEIVWATAPNDKDGPLKPWIQRPTGQRDPVSWAPQPGSQTAFLACPVVEVLYEGTRGPGKTDALLMDFAQHCGPDKRTGAQKAARMPQRAGFGAEWRGILFRRTYPELQDVIEKSRKWFAEVFPEARYNRAEHYWEWPTGEKLFFRHFKVEADYWSYHGHAYPWQGWEELTTWPSPACFKKMFSCSRSPVPAIPIKVRATTNPYGPGHNWVKARYRLPLAPKKIVGPLIDDALDAEGNKEPPRIAIHGELSENRVLLHADPGYIARIASSASNPQERRAWLHGDWTIVAGGMFDDVWNPQHNVIPNIPFLAIPKGWKIDRSYDHGQSAPFSVGWWAESNGEPIVVKGRQIGAVRGDLIRIAEWYGWDGNEESPGGVRMLSSEIAKGILERERAWGLPPGRVKKGPADASIFDAYEGSKSVAGDMKKAGVRWWPADKGPGSRIQGWQQVRKYMLQALPPVDGQPREKPGLFICENCSQFMRTVPVMSRDPKNLDDVDTDIEDHIGDEIRYRVRNKKRAAKGGSWA